MPRIIRQALAERLLKSPNSAAFLRDFSLASGLPLRFATALGVELPVAGVRPEPALCSWMQADPERSRLCARTIQEGAAGGMGCGMLCVAGLREAALPLKLGGELFGYLLVGQVATQPFDLPALNRWRHALERVGCETPIEELEKLAQGVTVIEEERFAAALRLLEWSAAQFVGQMAEHLEPSSEQLSPPIRRACAFMQANFDKPLTLASVAAEAGMSREHFCTTFHRATGLRFVEYLTRVRVERANELLKNTDRSVTDVALACGFQSISHFNRRFRSITDETPTQVRRRVAG